MSESTQDTTKTRHQLSRTYKVSASPSIGAATSHESVLGKGTSTGKVLYPFIQNYHRIKQYNNYSDYFKQVCSGIEDIPTGKYKSLKKKLGNEPVIHVRHLQDRGSKSAPTDYISIIRRVPDMLHYCGYVGVLSAHPLYGIDYSSYSDEVNDLLHPHGGVTWVGHNPIGVDIADVPGSSSQIKRLYENLWFIGFDCAHSGDLIPGMMTNKMLDIMGSFSLQGTNVYRDYNYLSSQVTKLYNSCTTIQALDPIVLSDAIPNIIGNTHPDSKDYYTQKYRGNGQK